MTMANYACEWPNREIACGRGIHTVSRVIPALWKMAALLGFEPSGNQAKQRLREGMTHLLAHLNIGMGAELVEIIADWPRLAEPLRAAILAIVSSANGDEGQ